MKDKRHPHQWNPFTYRSPPRLLPSLISRVFGSLASGHPVNTQRVLVVWLDCVAAEILNRFPMLDTAKEGTTILIDSSASDAVQDGAHAADADMASVELRGLQPRCDGPKLHPFAHRRAKIKFVKRLSDPDHEGQGHVFQVDIARKTYALKIVSFIARDIDS